MDVDLRQVPTRNELGKQALGDQLDGDAARDFPGVVAAHAVGKHREPGIVDEHRVLVMRTHHPRVGPVGNFKRGGNCRRQGFKPSKIS